jgi:hypothetical protein
VLPTWQSNRESKFYIIPGDPDGLEGLTC